MTTDVTTHAVESVKLAADLQPDTTEALRASSNRRRRW